VTFNTHTNLHQSPLVTQVMLETYMDVREMLFLLHDWELCRAPAIHGGRELVKNLDRSTSREEKWDCVPTAAKEMKIEGALCRGAWSKGRKNDCSTDVYRKLRVGESEDCLYLKKENGDTQN